MRSIVSRLADHSRSNVASSWSASLIHQQDASNNASRLASVSYARSLPFNASMFATAFKDFGVSGSTGVLVGLSIPLGQSVSVSSNVASAPGGAVGTVQASRSLGPEAGSIGWQAQDTEGATPYRQASLSYRSPYVTVQGGVSQNRAAGGGTFEASGAIATMGRDVFFSNRINDAFAVVDAGAPDVDVFYENRPAGKTDSHGMLLVPTLRSNQENRLSIDPSNLPVDAELETTRQVVTPADRTGTLVSIKMHTNTTAALVVFVQADGSFVPAGSWGKREGGNEFVVGYDGQSFIKDLSGANHVIVHLGDKTCQADFRFTAHPGEQVRIGPVKCQ